MRLVDLSHPVTIHSPGWVGYPGMKMWYFQTHQTNGIVSQMIETPLHLSTHLDAEMHGVSGGRDIASVSLDQCVGPAAIVDISEVGEWGVYTPELVQSKVEVRPRDILILHAGWAPSPGNLSAVRPPSAGSSPSSIYRRAKGEPDHGCPPGPGRTRPATGVGRRPRAGTFVAGDGSAGEESLLLRSSGRICIHGVSSPVRSGLLRRAGGRPGGGCRLRHGPPGARGPDDLSHAQPRVSAGRACRVCGGPLPTGSVALRQGSLSA